MSGASLRRERALSLTLLWECSWNILSLAKFSMCGTHNRFIRPEDAFCHCRKESSFSMAEHPTLTQTGNWAFALEQIKHFLPSPIMRTALVADNFNSGNLVGNALFKGNKFWPWQCILIKFLMLWRAIQSFSKMPSFTDYKTSSSRSG